jgi:hypothetical protein
VLVDAYASLQHYYDHIAPVWSKLTELGGAGTLYGPRPATWGPALRGSRPDDTRPILVASFADYERVAPAPVIYLEHGAGQTYDGDPQSARNSCYSGGDGLGRVVLFLCPSETVADRWRARYAVPAIAIGCPKLDAWHAGGSGARDSDGGRVALSTVAVTFHWRCPLVSESMTAWAHYDRALPQLVRWASDNGVRLLGHGHPRLASHLERRWRSLEVDHTRRLSDVFDQADLLIGDNTSALPEFASLGRPVLWLNAPWYRRDVQHGGRFWCWPRGQVQIDEPDQLIDGVQTAMRDEPDVWASREAMVRSIYAHTDGTASERAARSIMEATCRTPSVAEDRCAPRTRGSRRSSR